MDSNTQLHLLLTILILPTLFLLHRLGLWAEERGWIYWRSARHRKSTGSGGMGPALAEFEALFRPQARQVLQVKTTTSLAANKKRVPSEKPSN